MIFASFGSVLSPVLPHSPGICHEGDDTTPSATQVSCFLVLSHKVYSSLILGSSSDRNDVWAQIQNETKQLKQRLVCVLLLRKWQANLSSAEIS